MAETSFLFKLILLKTRKKTKWKILMWAESISEIWEFYKGSSILYVGKIFRKKTSISQPLMRTSICGALRDLVLFAQFKKRVKHPWRSVNFSKVAGYVSHIKIWKTHEPNMTFPWGKILNCVLTHSMLLVSFYTPWKHQKTSG